MKNRREPMAGLLNINTQEILPEVSFLNVVLIDSFKNHPFKVRDDEKMEQLVQSIKDNGIQDPLHVRIKKDRFELIAGHRRLEAAKRNNIEKVPVFIKDVDDETAAIMMVDSNFSQREEILPSEKAFAYKIKLEAIKRKAGRPEKNSRHGVGNIESADLIGEEVGESGRQIQRYIRLTELIPSLLDKIDSGGLGFIPAVDISYLTHEQQGMVEDVMNIGKTKPTKIQAAEMKKRSQEGTLTKKDIQSLMMDKKQEKFSSWNPNKKFKEVLPKKLQKEITPSKADEIFEEAMQLWLKEHRSEYEN